MIIISKKLLIVAFQLTLISKQNFFHFPKNISLKIFQKEKLKNFFH